MNIIAWLPTFFNFFCIQQKTKIHTGFEQDDDGEYVMTEFSLLTLSISS